jgi:hypothetical protein
MYEHWWWKFKFYHEYLKEKKMKKILKGCKD